MSSIEALLQQLQNRFKNECPHEIGVFLGYPIEDVLVFYFAAETPCLFTGYWKVYTNVNTAKRIFKAYDQAKEQIVEAIEQGVNPRVLLERYVS